MTGSPERRLRARLRVRRPDRFMPGYFYGLTEEARIVESGAREVFTPHRPIFHGLLLHGREPEVMRIVQALNTPGLQVVLSGPNGIGKSSVANVVAELMRQATTTASSVRRCDSTDTFETILQKPLAAAGVDVLRVESVLEETEARKADIGMAKVGTSRERQRMTSVTYRPDAKMGPAEAAEHLAPLSGLLVIDDLHTVSDDVRHKFVVLGKHLTECKSRLKLLLVGTTPSAIDLLGPAGSTIREVHLGTLTSRDLHLLITTGAQTLGMTIEEPVILAIIDLSAGFPHFAHLLALKCTESAIGAGRTHIVESDLRMAMATALEDADRSLGQIYDGANCPELLEVIAGLPHDQFTLDDLRKAGGPGQLPDQVVSDDGKTILRQGERGVYQFTDARMRSYVRIRHLLL